MVLSIENESTDFINEIKYDYTFGNFFKTTSVEQISSNINVLKDKINEISANFNEGDDVSKSLLYFLDSLFNHVDFSYISPQINGYINSISLDILDKVQFDTIFYDTRTHEVFNKFLTHHFVKSNPLQSQRLYESLIRCKSTHVINNNLFFFQIFTVKQLFDNQLYTQIRFLIENYKIDEFESVIPNEENFIHNQIFSYFHHLSYSLIITGSYEHAYNMISTTLCLTLETVDIPVFQTMLAELVYLSLKLNISSSNLNIAIIKYKSTFLPRVMDLLQNFFVYDFESFACNYIIMVLHFRNHKQELLLNIFTEEFLNDCVNTLLHNKLEVVFTKLKGSSMKHYEEKVNTQIIEINKKYEGFPVKLFPFKYTSCTNKTETSSQQIRLIQNQNMLVAVNKYLSQNSSL